MRADLLASALTVGSRYFSRDLLLSLFREELEMLKEASLVEEWVAEAEARAEARKARELLLALLRARFGELPPAVVVRVESAEPAWCEDLAIRLLNAGSLQELGLE